MSVSGSPPHEFGQPLSLARQVAQLLVVPVSAQLGSLHTPAEGSPYPSRDGLKKLIQEVGIGGVWLRDGHVAEAILLVEQLQDWASLPLLVAVDAGRGLPLPGATVFPHPLGLSRLATEAASWAEQWGRITSREAAAIGINWLLNPVAAPRGQTGLESLALAEDPATVLSLARAFVGGCEQTAIDTGSGILTTACSFPGLGWPDWLQEGSRFATATPNIPWRPQLTTPVAQLQDTLWLPFRHLVDHVGAILVSHVVLPEWDERWPITLLPGRLTQLLRQEWGFTGLIVVDALDQGFLAELADPATLAVRALQAGADLILAPPDPIQVMQGILDALQAGSQAQGYRAQASLNPAQIAQSVTRILRAKQRTMGGVSSLLKEVWPALAETDFTTVFGWMGATEWTDPGLHRGFPAEQLKPVLLGDPITKDSALGKLFSVRPGLPSRLQGAERLASLLAEPDIAPCQAAMARGGVEGGQPLSLPVEPGWLNWIWQDPPLGSSELSLESPALRIPSALRIPPLCSDALTPLPLLEAALANAPGLMVQFFLQDPLPNYLLNVLQQQRERIAVVVFYGSLPLYRRLREQFHWANAVHSLNRDPFAQKEVMRRLFPHLDIAEGSREARQTIKKK
ncbi:glycosyl hydrolase [Synechococcus sp. Nb3U1]|uniref:glycoside hydrolase family 3 N-terminal domain-containing protein n=1 Tax=Synechococcus sp. Nb3U1 TaxID=1914529 RepID=UPI001F273800|nr:glycoside hydrolase family 3 N-terminal domain-containing protein [Synechococcus sp. Nb3U1]MCF2969812.1 glycosyl hydrolase [Synechococcus sp. Nb3U1]